MTEAEWLVCADPLAMLFAVQADFYSRKTLLLECACCDRLRDFLPPVARAFRETIDPFIEGQVTDEQVAVDAVYQTAEAVAALYEGDHWMYREMQPQRYVEQELTAVLTHGLDELGPATLQGRLHALLDILCAGWDTADPEPGPAGWAEERWVHAALVRDILGNPFRRVSFEVSWLTPSVRAVARQMYEERDFGAVPILADALEDAGCTDEAILGHLRGPGPHVRGCWVIDRLLARE